MATTKNASRAKASEGNERRGRGPGIARETRNGKPTAYAVKKDVWSSRGEIKARGVRGLPDGPVSKSAVVRILDAKDNEAAAPFMLKGHTIVPVNPPAKAPAKKAAAEA